MSDIKTFSFSKDKFDQIKNYEFGRNWPVVYVIENGKEVYIGQTNAVHSRSKQHYENPERSKLKNIHIITDAEYNKSATSDIESWLIEYMAGDGMFLLQNGNGGLQNHNYYDREKYKTKFELIWEKLKKISLVKHDLIEIRNSDLFKYSPYKALTEDQIIVARDLFENIKSGIQKSYIINGKPGTGKTILAVYLIKYLKEQEETKHLQVALVVPMTQLRGTIRKVFSKVKGLKSDMVIGPNDVTKKVYDILIVDEAHRLKQRRQITNYASFDKTNIKLGFDKLGTELDWILKSSKSQMFFYDKNQSVRPADINPQRFSDLEAIHYNLISQQRIDAGEEFTNFIDDVFDLREVSKYNFPNYDLRVYDDIHKMVSDIKNKNSELGLCRIVAGYAWEWKSKRNPNMHDIEIDGLKLTWNSTNQDWVNSKNAINEVGCIHTIQGYDLNYVGVIIGPELSYNEEKTQLVIHAENYMDANGWRGISDPKELQQYIINIYKTLLTRGVKGTYIYIVDKKLEKYFRDKMKTMFSSHAIPIKEIVSPYLPEMIEIPLVGSAPCGEPLLGENNIEEMIMVEKSKIRPGANYFILRAKGDSMNKAGINDGDLVLCRHQEKGETGDRVVALLGNNVTIKMYAKKDGRRILLPNSTNSSHQPIIPDEGDSVQGIVQEVIEKTR